MNEKEAGEIIKTFRESEYNDINDCSQHNRAIGYLEGIEKAKVLEECIDGLICGTCDGETAEEVLRKWGRIK